MNAKRTLVSFLAIATLLFLATTVSALTVFTDDGAYTGIVDGLATVEINGMTVTDTNKISVIAGETITVNVKFTVADLYDNPDTIPLQEIADGTELIRMEAELGDFDAETDYFNVEGGNTLSKTLTLVVPNELEDELSDDMVLTLNLGNSDFESEAEITLRVQRPSYNVEIMSILVSNTVEAGQIAPVDVVLENTGYNDLDNLYVTVRIPELGVEKTSFFGDLAVSEDEHHHHDDDDTTTSGRIYLEVPYNVASGIYTLEVEVANEDFSDVVKREVSITNGFPEVVMKSGDDLLVLNPTNNLKVYKVIYPSAEMTIAVQAGSSKLVSIETLGEQYNFDVFVFDGEKLVGTINYAGVSESETLTSPVVLLTVILAIIFVVLLVVMIVLITKKPEKTEEFGESYY